MPDPRLLTAAELELMHVLWAAERALTVQDVVDRLPGRAYTTIATLLKILEDKGFAMTQREGRKLLYEPHVHRPEYEGTAVRDIVQRVFSGDAAALIRTLAQGESLTEYERAMLHYFLAERGEAGS